MLDIDLFWSDSAVSRTASKHLLLAWGDKLLQLTSEQDAFDRIAILRVNNINLRVPKSLQGCKFLIKNPDNFSKVQTFADVPQDHLLNSLLHG